MAFFQTLLQGSALMWWNNEITIPQRTEIRKQGLTNLMSLLEERFYPDAAQAARKLNRGTLTLENCFDNQSALTEYIQRKMRHARAAGTLNVDLSTWHGTMVNIWASLDHLKICASKRDPIRREKELVMHIEPLSVAEYTIKTAPTEDVEKVEARIAPCYTHTRTKAKTNPDSESIEICMDGGAGRSFVDKAFLQLTEHSIEKREISFRGVVPVKGFTNQWATFSFYLPGRDKEGKPTLMKFTKAAWVVDDLPPKVLLGVDFTHPYEAVTSAQDDTITFGKLDGFQIDFDVVPASQEAFLAVEYKPLPQGRPFSLESENDAVMHAVVDAKTPKVVLVRNQTNGILKIDKRARIGHIRENTDRGAFATTMGNGLKALKFGKAFGALAAIMRMAAAFSATSNTPTSDTSLALPQATEILPVLPAVNSQFEMSNMVVAITDGSYRPNVNPEISLGNWDVLSTEIAAAVAEIYAESRELNIPT
ncbi:hypothetical protein B0T22DRAFT_524103 [Podospora appendiculata]|uniref:Uncharacterized protein n=1 Tax=Podospora appendiculata TaxID=314037 RepID=A0AAE0WYA7_9PEZI|nr:hypothetical protein B0T22DRAFT_524103 [Podospora appendiculata]